MTRLIAAAGTAGFVGVALGAFGAHALEARLSPEAQGWWETATFYALTHAAAALAAALSGRHAFARAGWAFIIGAVIFAGSLYAMALGAPGYLGAVTPLGGLSFLAGWGLVVAGGMKRD
jgi:uncharacterized membrane protein YgdD (TMEM256/DUF423 family)